MPGPYPLPTLAAQVTPTGISAPTYDDVLASLVASYQNIYGPDAYLQPDSQDGQLLAVFAAAINDANSSAIAVYNSFSPATGVGAGLSSNVKINGLTRQGSSHSTVDVTLFGNPTTIVNGVVQSVPQGDQWALPATVNIPVGGSITVTATALQPGPIIAGPGTVTGIVTPTQGWASVTNAAAATVGAPVESDAQLRQRQAVSTSLAAQTPFEAMWAAVANVSGVTEVQGYENDTSGPDANGIPGHSVAFVVAGGLDTDIANAIATNKLGTGTFGTTQVVVTDQNGVSDTINFSRAQPGATLIAAVNVKPLAGYLNSTGTAVQNAMSAWVAGLPVGGDVYLLDLLAAARLPNAQGGGTYTIEADQLTIALAGQPLATADVPIAWNQQAALPVANITLTLVT
jgi:uncharacterized phage protein gp47/JayE